MSLAVLLAPNTYRIKTAGDFINTFAFVEGDGSVTLVDCGISKAPPRIVAGLAELGKSPADVQRILLTHAHPDHAGGAADMVEQTSATGIGVHEDEAEYVQAGRPPMADQAELGPFGKVFARFGKNAKFSPAAVAELLTDGQLLDIGGGLRVHHTPGHSPGHISLVHEPSGTLITGDALFNMASYLSWPPPFLCQSATLNKQTAHVLGELEYSTVAFTHGPHISTGAREAVRGFLKKKDALQ